MATGIVSGSSGNFLILIFVARMELKDYYAILELEPRAGPAEIRKAYRRLAMALHPDKNPDDPYAKARFEEIREAYEVLIDPGKKENYLQQRWYYFQSGNRKPSPPVTPDAFLKQLLEIDRHISKLDQFRMDRYGLQNHILELLSDERIEKLNGFRDISVNDEIAGILIRCFGSLSYKMLGQPVAQLRKIELSDHVRGQVNAFIIRRKNNDQWEKYKPWLILMLVISICVLIYLSQQ